MTPTVALVTIVVLVAWLTAAAAGVRSVSRIWLRHWVEQRLRGFQVAADFLDRPQSILLAAGAGTGLLVLLAGVVLARVVPPAWPALPLAVAGYALVLLFAGQAVPAAFGRRFASRLLPVLLPPLRAVEVATWPLTALARGAVALFDRGVSRDSTDPRDNIEDLLREGELEGVGERDEIAIISGVMQFGEKVVRDVMTPRSEVFALDAASPPDELARRIAQAAYSRVPIYRGTLDDVLGMVHVFDVLKAAGEQAPPLRPVAFATAKSRCNDLLFAMLRARNHLAIVRGDDGRTVGIVTLEDMLEELVGDIRDEHDEPQPAPRAQGA
ncbi:MAG TPA: CBS domain-containing protein [Gemmatimonadaceae bacterium]|nr:CBS domain-containing protein [Gemmatimonadaceae bacterium]